ncbi:hypothetical protein R3P38DRAFT_2511411 [Favolaschia claudopus]|uniref:Uncharacterized protein n=1 Tax=Favolaschia claudopus TaxID=2862362 RepID=A0AAW0CS55_9AGAR
MGKNGKKRQRKRVAREDRKNLRLWAEGARESILTPHLDAYQAALDQGRRQERKFLKSVCREFHARVNWRTKDHEEPIVLDWDPSAMEVVEELSGDDERARAARVDELNKRIRRWFLYRLRKLRKQKPSSGLDPTKDPYAVLLGKLSGLAAPPKARQAYQQFMHESYNTKVAPVVAEQWEAQRIENTTLAEKTKEPKAGFRAQVARQVFSELPESERAAIADRAKQEASDARAAYTAALKSPPSQSAAARQKCIDGLPDFVAPILQGINQHTGLHVTLLVGGPIPEFGGDIRTVHLSYGRNRTALAQHWPQWDKARFSENVSKFMIEYLHTAYSKSCRHNKMTSLAYTHDHLAAQDCAQSALAAPDLTGAAYTISADANNEDDESDSDSSDPSSDSSSSESSSDEEEEEATRARKKRKLSGGKEKQSTARRAKAQSVADDIENRPPPAPRPSVQYQGITEEERQQNIARNKKLLAQLQSDISADMQTLKTSMGGKAKGKRTARPRAEASRKSQRLAAPVQPAPDNSTPAAESAPSSSNAPSPSAPSLSSSNPASSDPASSGPSSSDPASSGPSSSDPASSGPSSSDPASSNPSFSDPASLDDSLNDDHSHDSIPEPHLSHPPAEPVTNQLPPVSHAAQLAISSNLPIPPPPHSPPDLSFTPCPPKAAPWFVEAYKAMTNAEFGSNYQALVAAWTRMEAASRFEHGPSNLPARLRPKPIGVWISSSRRTEPIVTDPTAFATQWKTWWDSLQPDWRKKDKDGCWSITDGYGGGGREWGPLYQWGVNGVLSVVASLLFWGRAVQGNPELRCVWDDAVTDVTWMFEGMAIYYEMFKGKF